MSNRPGLVHHLRVALLATSAGVLVFAFLLAATAWAPMPERGLTRVASLERDLDQIRQEGVLRVAIFPDEIAWSVRRGRPEGFSHDLVSGLVGSGLRLEFVKPSTPAVALRDLAAGRVDIVALAGSGPRIPLTDVLWSEPIAYERPVAVGRRARTIRTVTDLEGETVAVRRHSNLETLAMVWRERLGGRLSIVRIPSDWTDKQIALGAARGEFTLALLDERRARLEAAVYRALEVSAPLDEPLPVRWALRVNAPNLAEAVATYLDDARRTGFIADLERRYIENPERLRAKRRPLFREEGDHLSPWDGIFRDAAHHAGFDWRLLAALCFAESGYDPWQVSSAGAIGLLQLMPATAAAWGAADPFDPAQNVSAGARHLRWLYDMLEGVPDPDRLAFALAAYNFGFGHLEDARELAIQRGLDPRRWAGNVETVLPLLEDEAIAENLRHGGAKGTVTLRYVNHVLEVYRGFTETDALAKAVAPIAGS